MLRRHVSLSYTTNAFPIVIHRSDACGILVSTWSSRGVSKSQHRIKNKIIMIMIHTLQRSMIATGNKMIEVSVIAEQIVVSFRLRLLWNHLGIFIFNFFISCFNFSGIARQPQFFVCLRCHSMRCCKDGFFGIGCTRCHSLFSLGLALFMTGCSDGNLTDNLAIG